MRSKNGILLGLAALVGALGALHTSHAVESTTPPVKIGMVQTLFTDIPQSIISWLSSPFTQLMKEQTGIEGQLVVGGDAFHLGKELHENRLQLGVFHGFEFAWAQQKYPDLRPLMIAINKNRQLRADLVVKKDSAVAGFTDVRGKDLAMARRTKAPVRLFLERGLAECGQADPKAFFGHFTNPPSTEDALDDVVAGRVQAAVVDDLSLEFYGELKPGCHARLKVAKQSEGFPAAVIAYREGALDEKILARFRDGMVNAKKNEKAREVMSMFHITAFEPIPADYAQSLAAIMRVYPPEVTEKTKTTTTPTN
jgi:ABC-type phosphate/phosphonate transport system substrate-binding protein